MRAVMDGTTELQESSRATRSPHALSRFVYLVQHMLTVMDGATELQVGLRALALVLHIVLTAIPAALIVTTGKSHNGPS